MRLALEPDIEVVGEAEDGNVALTVVKELSPDVVLMDIEMPELDGIQTTMRIKEQFPQVAVIMLSIRNDLAARNQALNAGALAYVEKRGGVVTLLEDIRKVIGRHTV